MPLLLRWAKERGKARDFCDECAQGHDVGLEREAGVWDGGHGAWIWGPDMGSGYGQVPCVGIATCEGPYQTSKNTFLGNSRVFFEVWYASSKGRGSGFRWGVKRVSIYLGLFGGPIGNVPEFTELGHFCRTKLQKTRVKTLSYVFFQDWYAFGGKFES